MKVAFIFKTDKLPVTYRTSFMSLIKEALKNQSAQYYNDLYFWNGKKNKHPKPFTFAIRFSNFHIDGDYINLYNEELSLYISSIDVEFLIRLYNGLIDRKLYPYPLSEGNKISFIRSFLINEKELKNETVSFKTMSPILIENEDKKPLLPDDTDFQDEFNKLVNKELSTLRGYGLKKELHFIPIKIKKDVVKHRINEFTEKTGKKYMMLTAFSGSFTLQGDIEDLDYLYKSGVGIRRSEGMGYVEVI